MSANGPHSKSPTIALALQLSRDIPSETALLDAELLLSHVLECERSYFRTWPEKPLSAAQYRAYQILLDRRIEGEPVAHMLGNQSFWNLELTVSPQTLIPRGDTEILVEQALLLDIPKHARVLDLGTGTGAIALALASERPDWNVYGTDYCHEIVQLARSNGQRNGLARVEFYEGHWFDALPVGSNFDLIISNPPYIADGDPHLQQGDLRFEPETALVAARAGLADIEHIVLGARMFLADDGWLMIEHGYDQAYQVRSLFENSGYVGIRSVRDYGDNERMTQGRRISPGF